MSLDERIRQLSDSVVDELRGPLEASLRRLVGELFEAAHPDRSADARTHRAELDDLRGSLMVSRDSALAAQRASFDAERETAIASERARLVAEHDAALTALRETLTHQHEADLAAVRDQAAVEREAVVQALSDELGRSQQDSLVEFRRTLEAEQGAALVEAREQAGRERDEALAALQDRLVREHAAEVEALRERLEQEHQSALAALREDHVVAKEEAVLRARLSSDAHVASAAALEEELDAVRAQARTVEEARAAVEQRLALLRDELHAMTCSKATLEEELSTVRNEAGTLAVAVDAAVAERDAARAELSLATSAATGNRDRDVAEAHSVERQAELACSEQLLDTLRRMDEATTLTGVLTVLAEGISPEAGRALVLIAHGGRLRAWRAVGFGDLDLATIDLAVDSDPLLSRALSSGRAVATSDVGMGGRNASLPSAFAVPADRLGLAVPVTVGARTVALAYVDDATENEPTVPSNWPELAEVLARHAGRCLEVLTVSASAARMRGAPDVGTPRTVTGPSPIEERQREEESARRYARLLLSEVKLYNEDAVDEGRRAGDLLARLGTQIERARRLYEEKIPLAVRERMDCFDDELVRTLAGGDRTLLGQIT